MSRRGRPDSRPPARSAAGSVLNDAGLEVVKSGVRMPRMNSVMERWVGSVRRECLDRLLLMTGEGHFPKVLGENERRYNHYRPHRSRDRQPPQPPQPPQPAVAAARLDRVRLKREEVLNGLINEYRRAA